MLEYKASGKVVDVKINMVNRGGAVTHLHGLKVCLLWKTCNGLTRLLFSLLLYRIPDQACKLRTAVLAPVCCFMQQCEPAYLVECLHHLPFPSAQCMPWTAKSAAGQESCER